MNFYGSIIFSPTITDEEFERAMDILDFCCTEEGQEIINMGFEGKIGSGMKTVNMSAFFRMRLLVMPVLFWQANILLPMCSLVALFWVMISSL